MKTAMNNLFFFSIVGIPYIAVAVISPGTVRGKLFTVGIALMLLGLGITLYYWKKGQKADQCNDERENFIIEKSMKFTFYIMAASIQFCFAYNLANPGYKFDYLFILLAILWGSFVAANCYNRLRV